MWVRCATALIPSGTRDEYGLTASSPDHHGLVLWKLNRLGGVNGPRSLTSGSADAFYPAQRGEGLTDEQVGLIERYATRAVYDRASGAWKLPEPEDITAPPAGTATSGNRVPSPQTVYEITRELVTSRLVKRAEELRVDATDLDELVIAALHAVASRQHNSGAHPGLTAHAAFDTVHDDADERATAVNNKGLEAQLWLLAQSYGEQAVHDLLAKQAGAADSDV
jgi:hypothetical protein